MTPLPRKLCLCLCLSALSGCSHYQLPVNPIESPEALGTGRGPRIEAPGLRMGTDLTDVATKPAPTEKNADPAPELSKSIRPFVGAMASISPKLDLGLRLALQSPFTLRARYQVTGASLSDARAGNLSFAVVPHAGFLLGTSSGETVSYLAAGLALPVGYRAWDNHLAIVTPFFNYGSLSGVSRPLAGASTSATAGNTTTGGGITATQLGGAIGYEYSLQRILQLRVELAYVTGSSGADKLGGLYAAAVAGYDLGP